MNDNLEQNTRDITRPFMIATASVVAIVSVIGVIWIAHQVSAEKNAGRLEYRECVQDKRMDGQESRYRYVDDCTTYLPDGGC